MSYLHTMHHNVLRKTVKFTLIELLAVIAIIVIMVSLLMPALSKVKEKTRSISCTNNQKQIGVAMMMYLQDNAERFPPWARTWKSWQWHMIKSWQYLPNFAVLACSASKFYPTGYPEHPEYNYMSYNANQQIINYNEMDGTGISYGLQSIKKPFSQTILFGDGYNAFSGLISVIEMSGGYDLSDSIHTAHFRHSGGGNFSYVDGHVNWILKKNMPTDRTKIPWARE